MTEQATIMLTERQVGVIAAVIAERPGVSVYLTQANLLTGGDLAGHVVVEIDPHGETTRLHLDRRGTVVAS